MSNRINLISRERHATAILNPNRFEFNPEGRMPWLQRFLFKLLRWLKADSYDTSVTYTTVKIDPPNILDALMRNRVDVERLYNKRARYVVMGASDFQRFSTAPEINDMLRFNFMAPFGMNGQRTILGLDVVIVPWIEGFFVMPDLEGEQSIAIRG